MTDISSEDHDLLDRVDRFPPIASCGSCRELLADYAPDARILVPVGDPTEGDEEFVVRTVGDLLPDAAWHGV